MLDEDIKRTNFAKNYTILNSLFYLFSSVTVTILSVSESASTNRSVIIAKIGENLCSSSFLSIQTLFLFASIIVSKHLSGYRGALIIPSSEEFSLSWNSNRRTTFAKKLGKYLRYWTGKITPLKAVFKYLTFLIISWVFLDYIVICFGAPLINDHWKTGSFVTLLSCQSIWPILLIEGLDLENVQSLIQGQELDELRQVLYYGALGASIGSWCGAFPIPLDWDRPWQTWLVD